MHFTGLRLHGFKSFVEPTELAIDPGLTGIVGPNGCGKSNLVEALQWVMGEGSARRLRGADMDDVIFGGTSSRPPRNVASVTLSVEDPEPTEEGRAALPKGTEVDRRIERGKGSSYRLNGREMRARDVQILFADAASGAGSAALIGQGRIGWLINAKPAERRSLLEEAAGIGGLHARRHEAELRLNSAESNLARLGDVQAGLTAQLERLRKQARQAERYRKLSEQLRQVEALALYRHWHDQAIRLERAGERLAEAETRVTETKLALDAAEAARLEAQTRLPALREAAAVASRQAERQAAATLALEAEATRVAAALGDAERRLTQHDQDIAREQTLAADAATALARLAEERRTIEVERAVEAAAIDAARAALDQAAHDVAEAEAAFNDANAKVASAAAARAAVEKRLAAIEDRRRRVQRQLADAIQRTEEIDLLAVAPERLAAAAAAIETSEAVAAQARTAYEAAEAAVRAAEAARQAIVAPAREAEARAIKLAAETDGLKSLVASGLGRNHQPVVDAITVEPGLETALGAVLGDDLLASLDAHAPIRWAELVFEADAPPALPAGVRSLADAAEAPAALRRRLAHIGVVADAEIGDRLHKALRPGQRLVSIAGAVWRWDGLTQAAGAPSAAATRLAQNNRLRVLAGEREAAEQALAALRTAERERIAALGGARAAEKSARAEQLQAGQRIAELRQAQLVLVQQHGQVEAKRQAAVELRDRLRAEAADLDAQAAEARGENQLLPEPSSGRAEADAARARFLLHRQTETAAQRTLDQLSRDRDQRAKRSAAIDSELISWTERRDRAMEQRATLDERRAALATEVIGLSTRPHHLAAELAALKAALTEARGEAQTVSDRLRQEEAAAHAVEQRTLAASRRHAEAREDRVRAEAAEDQALEARDHASERARGGFDCPAEHLPRVAGIAAEPPQEAAADLDTRLDRLRREREAMGPVNLMAETEIVEIGGELETIRAEADDLVAAIARLRLAIQQLNKEGSDRLTAAFDRVNEHFGRLFVRLFGGGNAHLELIKSEGDPLAAGLEIMACPPGKRLQVLSLMSGGERALTALALIFAVFLTNPAPVCVLDEVDAPLDDANVERFCRLVREIGARTQTRFLIVTHHRVTMAQMDRLYGVTMAERGVSQLVSVELQVAEQLRQSA